MKPEVQESRFQQRNPKEYEMVEYLDLSSNCGKLGVSSRAPKPKLDNWEWEASWYHTLDSGRAVAA